MFVQCVGTKHCTRNSTPPSPPSPLSPSQAASIQRSGDRRSRSSFPPTSFTAPPVCSCRERAVGRSLDRQSRDETENEYEYSKLDGLHAGTPTLGKNKKIGSKYKYKNREVVGRVVGGNCSSWCWCSRRPRLFYPPSCRKAVFHREHDQLGPLGKPKKEKERHCKACRRPPPPPTHP